MRLALFTDTLGDINGVSRFLTTLAAHAHRQQLPLLVLTSTRFPVPGLPTIRNISPSFSHPIPRYPQLQLALPSRRALAAAADAFNPTHIHVSTPGPVGYLGRAYALKRGLPLAGTYHTDFPAYIDRLFDHESLTALTASAMRWFYRPFTTIFSRSAEYATHLEQLGIPRDRLVRLRPGIDLELFRASNPPAPSGGVGRGSASPGAGALFALSEPEASARKARGSASATPDGQTRKASSDSLAHASGSDKPFPLPPTNKPFHLLYVGRISVEKNLPFLTTLWPQTLAALRASGINAKLTITGEGPYEPVMQAALAAHNTRFAGVLRCRALADIYRSADLFLFPSTTDTLGQAVMEAQACGLPALISTIGGPSEIVLRDRTALALPITHAAWHNAILRLAADRELLTSMSQAAATHGASFPFAASADHFWSSHSERPALRVPLPSALRG